MPKPKSCSVCCIAMLAKITFDEAMKNIFCNKTQRSLNELRENGSHPQKAGLKTTP